MTACPRCSSELSEDAGPCPECGFDPTELESPGERRENDPATLKAIAEAIDSVSKALETGLDVASAQAELTEAQEALADGDEEAARDHAVEAKRLAEDAKRYARAMNMVDRTKRDFERLAREGMNLEVANGHLAAAEEALTRGLYGEVQNHVRLARESGTEAKRRGAALSILQREEARVQAEARRGVDISRVLVSLNETQVAVDTMNSQQFKRSIQDARLELKVALERKKLEDACLAVREELEELARQGAPVEPARELLAAALSEKTEIREAWQGLGRARRAAKSARDHLNREVVANTVQRIVEHAAQGHLTSGQAKEMIREVQDALEKGEAVQVEAMIEGRLASRDNERVRASARALQNLTERLLTLRRAEIELTEAEDQVQAAKAALDAGRFDDAEGVLSDLKETTDEMLGVVTASTQAMLERAQHQVGAASGLGLDIGEAAKMVEGARSQFQAGRLPEAIEMAKSAEAQAVSAIEAFEEAKQREEERRRGEGGRASLLRARLAQSRDDMRTLAGAGLDCRPAEGPLDHASAAIDHQGFDDAEKAIASAESMLASLWAALRREAQNILERARRQHKAAEADLLTPETITLLEKSEHAFEEKHYRLAVELGEAFLSSLERGRTERAAERARVAEDRARRAQEQVERVRGLLEQVRTVLGDEEAVDEAERELSDVAEGDMEGQVAAVERVAERLSERLRMTAQGALDEAAAAIEEATGIGSGVDDAQLELDLGQEMFNNGDFVSANKHARGAERRAFAAADRRRQDIEFERRRRADASRAMIVRMKATIEDLARADIQMEGGLDAIRAAQKAHDDGGFEAVEAILEPFHDLAGSLRDGLRVAAETFLQKEHIAIITAKAEGLEVPRAEKVLATAQQAVTEQKFVEALEYHKVIGDIIMDAKRERELGQMAQELGTLRKELQRGVPGEEAQQITSFLDVAEQHMRKGSFEQFRTEVRKARDVLDAARRALMAGRLDRMARDLASAKELGAEIPLADDLYEEAKIAASRGDLAALAEYGERIAEITDQARRKLLRQRSVRELREVREVVEVAAQAGMDLAEAEGPLREAEEALQEGSYDQLAGALEKARALVSQVRRTHYEEVYGERLRGLQESLFEAKGLGVANTAAEQQLTAAAAAITGGDFDTADLALQKAQLAAGREVSRYLGNRHPDLHAHAQEAGLQSDRWNPIRVEVENRGSVGARDVRLTMQGNADLSEVPPIPALDPGAKAVIPVNVRPRAPGKLDVEFHVTYRRVLDDLEYTAGEKQEVQVQGGGTYLVEDVFVIHVDGRLLFHVGGANREIDEDIFSGMLSVVQDFVRDAFKTRSGKGLRRFEFGHYKVLIERSKHLFVAVKVAGEEPELLSLYMAEILREGEERYGAILEHWGGLLNDVSGIEDLARKLLLVSDRPDAPMGELAKSPVTAALRALQRAREAGADDFELRDLLSKAKTSAEGDVEIAWSLMNGTGDAAHRAESRVEDHMGALVSHTHAAAAELRSLGADMGQAQVLVEESEQALARKDFVRVRQIDDSIRGALDIARIEKAAAGLQAELRGLVEDLERCKGAHMHVNHVEEALVSVQEVIASKDVPRAQGMIRRARQMLEEEKGKSASRWVQQNLARLAKLLHEADSEGLGLPEVKDLFAKATAAASEGRESDARLLLETIDENVRPKIKKYLVDHFPRLQMHIPSLSFQMGEARKCIIELENRGNAVATEVELELSGDFEFGGARKVGRLGPGENRVVAVSMKPKREGDAQVDARLKFRRPLEEAVHTVVDSSEVRVHRAGTYPVARALLFDAKLHLVSQEARTLFERNDSLASEVAELLGQAYTAPDAPAFRRITGEGESLLIERGADRYVAVLYAGEEPGSLPLFMVDCLRLIAKEGAEPERELDKLLWVSQDAEADRGPLEDSPLVSAVVLVGGGSDGGLLQKARAVIEERDFDAAMRYIAKAEETTVISRDELKAQLTTVLGEGETPTMSDEEMRDLIELVKRVLTAVGATRQRLGIHSRWPLKKVAVRPEDEETFDMIMSFKKLLTTQTLAREFEVLRPDEAWRGMKLELAFHPEHMNRIYKSWAKRVELMLKRQDPWKIKAGLDKGEYSVGIEGQKVMVSPEAVSFQISLPERCAEEPFRKGIVYVDATIDKGIEGEGLARELVAAVLDEREKSGVPHDAPADVTVDAGEALPPLLRDWLGLIKGEGRIVGLTFGKVKRGGAHVVGGNPVRVSVAQRKD